jgi:hypothetical protein
MARCSYGSTDRPCSVTTWELILAGEQGFLPRKCDVPWCAWPGLAGWDPCAPGVTGAPVEVSPATLPSAVRTSPPAPRTIDVDVDLASTGHLRRFREAGQYG